MPQPRHIAVTAPAADPKALDPEGEVCRAISPVLVRVGDKWSVLVVTVLGSGPAPLQRNQTSGGRHFATHADPDAARPGARRPGDAHGDGEYAAQSGLCADGYGAVAMAAGAAAERVGAGQSFRHRSGAPDVRPARSAAVSCRACVGDGGAAGARPFGRAKLQPAVIADRPIRYLHEFIAPPHATRHTPHVRTVNNLPTQHKRGGAVVRERSSWNGRRGAVVRARARPRAPPAAATAEPAARYFPDAP